MSTNALVSIIMPAYNRAWSIRRALDSVLAQSYPHFEVVITDDGSTDNTREVVASYQDERIRYLKFDHNRGVVAARNNSILAARGEWILFFDSDDELWPDCLQTFLDVATKVENKNYGIFFANIIDSQTGETKVNPFWRKKLSQNPVISYSDFLCNKSTGDFFPFLKRELFDTVPYVTKSRRNLHNFWHKMFRISDVIYVDKDVALCHTEGNDRITRNRAKDAPLWIEGIEEYLATFGEDILASCPKQIAFHLKSLALYRYLAGERGKARKTLFQALRYDPLNISVWVYLAASFVPSLFNKLANR